MSTSPPKMKETGLAGAWSVVTCADVLRHCPFSASSLAPTVSCSQGSLYYSPNIHSPFFFCPPTSSHPSPPSRWLSVPVCACLPARSQLQPCSSLFFPSEPPPVTIPPHPPVRLLRAPTQPCFFSLLLIYPPCLTYSSLPSPSVSHTALSGSLVPLLHSALRRHIVYWTRTVHLSINCSKPPTGQELKDPDLRRRSGNFGSSSSYT